MKLVAGLGNPGKEYEATRHNVGFKVIDRFAARLGSISGTKGVKFKRKYLGSFVVVPFPEGDLTGLLKPKTFMNRSGRSIGRAMREVEIKADKIIVIHDDIDLPIGRIKVKSGGGAGGHRGVKSVIDVLGTADFMRLRVGIDRPESGDVTDYVLEEFTAAESVILENEVIPVAVEALIAILTEGVDVAMNEFNG